MALNLIKRLMRN